MIIENSKEISKSNRIAWIDMAKGCGMILVISAHIGVPHANNLIYSFHLPLFFFLSGYVFSIKRNDIGFFVKGKIKSLIKPYFTLGSMLICFAFFVMFFDNTKTAADYFEIVLRFILQIRMWTLWFLACLFFLNIIFFFLTRISKNEMQLGIISFVLCFIGLVYYRFGGKPLPWNIDACFTALPFFFVGYILKEKKIIDSVITLNQHKKLLYFVLFVFLNVLTLILNSKLSGSALEIFQCQYGIPIITYISAFSGVFYMILFSTFFTLSFVQYIGQNSLIYFALHQNIAIPIANKLLGHFYFLQFNEYLVSFSMILLVLLINTIFVLFINNTPLKKFVK